VTESELCLEGERVSERRESERAGEGERLGVALLNHEHPSVSGHCAHE